MLWSGALVALALIAAEPAAETPKRSQGNETVRVVRVGARWTGLGGPDALSDHGDSFFLISGTIQNVGQQTIAWVKLAFDLVDDEGVVVASEYGFNRRAEDLHLPDYEEGRIRRSDLDIPPLLAGSSDDFRMLFLRGSVPKFADWRVRVLEVGRD